MSGDLIDRPALIAALEAEQDRLADLDDRRGGIDLAIGVVEQAGSRERGEPMLGLATTRQLLDEVAARIEVDYFRGGGGLEYSTVTGRPAPEATS